ncbi:hypothetical protein D9611_002206 [Ephemerocybe angulata]|uniref:IMD domain-containing protein n=1 Tax=Ephemerocybe angulata TaxID=980116 RepID=A0A8H5C2B1_9AGAR|nr:hypothetical protein D9611_002206 [Tulosesus angulatus]
MAPSRPRSLRAFTFSSSKRAMSPGPPSPTFSDATNASAMNFGANGPSKIITRANLKASTQAYEDLVSACSTYRAALVTMSKATAAFADAIERCSGLKGPSYEAGTRMQAASGVQHLVGNLYHVLADTLDKNFERPLRQHLDVYRATVQDRSQSYERALREKSQAIRDTEMRSLNRKERNLQTFRQALTVLQQQVDDLDELKANHYLEIVEHEEKVWDVVQTKVCVLVRSTMDVFDRVTAKASDPIIEPMLQSVPDPFDSYGIQQSEDQIFSILAPLSIMSAPSPSPSPSAGTPENEASATFLPSAHPKITSWLPGTTNGLYPVESAEWATASPPASPPSSSPPSSNPAPNRRNTLPQRKAESKLRSVLPSIDEKRPRSPLSDSATPRPSQTRHTSEISNPPLSRPAATTPTASTSSSSSNPSTYSINATIPPQHSGPATTNGIFGALGAGGGGFGFGTWNFGGYGQSPYGSHTPEDEGSGDNQSATASTPRMSTLFAPPLTQSPPPPPGSPPNLDLNHTGGDGGTNILNESREGDDKKSIYEPVPT